MSQASLKVRHCQIENIVVSRRHNIVQLAFLLLVLDISVLGAWIVVSWMKNLYHFPVSQLVVTGGHYTTNQDISQAMQALRRTPGNFLTKNVNLIQQQIALIPWIKQVSVRKQWPNEIKIHVIEYVPVASWNNFYLLDKRGKIFSVPDNRLDNSPIPMLYGPVGSEKDVLFGYRNLDQVLTAAKLQLQSVRMSPANSWQLILQNNILLELGRYDKIKRLQRFIGIYPVLIQQIQQDNKRIMYVDLRYDVGLAVGWSPACIALENSHQQ